MVFAAVTWAYKEVITSAKLAQMVENIRAHDHRSDGTQGDGTPFVAASLTAGYSGSIHYARRGGTIECVVNCSKTDGTAIAPNTVLATLPVGFRPAQTKYVIAIYSSSGAVGVGLRIDTNGQITNVLQVPAGIGSLLTQCAYLPA